MLWRFVIFPRRNHATKTRRLFSKRSWIGWHNKNLQNQLSWFRGREKQHMTHLCFMVHFSCKANELLIEKKASEWLRLLNAKFHLTIGKQMTLIWICNSVTQFRGWNVTNKSVSTSQHHHNIFIFTNLMIKSATCGFSCCKPSMSSIQITDVRITFISPFINIRHADGLVLPRKKTEPLFYQKSAIAQARIWWPHVCLTSRNPNLTSINPGCET